MQEGKWNHRGSVIQSGMQMGLGIWKSLAVSPPVNIVIIFLPCDLAVRPLCIHAEELKTSIQTETCALVYTTD